MVREVRQQDFGVVWSRQSSRTGADHSLAGVSERLAVARAARQELPVEERDLPGQSEARAARVRELAERDRVVRMHELKHAAVLGALAGRIHYFYASGPDGKSYAVGGYTEVNTLPLGTPEMTGAKARVLRAAALSAGLVSGGDRAVAIQATQMEQAALAQA